MKNLHVQNNLYNLQFIYGILAGTKVVQNSSGWEFQIIVQRKYLVSFTCSSRVHILYVLFPLFLSLSFNWFLSDAN